MFDMNAFLGFELKDQRECFRNDPKTIFQTNIAWDEKIAIPVDAVIVHRHGSPAEDIATHLQSWDKEGYVPQRMFFSDSDAGWYYTHGQFDGKKHEDDIELTRNGDQVLCGGSRPYMLPTQGWIDYLKAEAKKAIDGGAKAIYPEEPLAHNHSGYEKSFKELYEKRYGTPWEPSHTSPDVLFKTCQLKSELYTKLEQDLADFTEEYAKQNGKSVDFYIPIHSLYSNLSAHLVAPLGNSLAIKGHKGYIGQIWTGPVRWTLGNYSDKSATFFDAAYLLYDYFVNLVKESPQTLYLLGDPVEDDPSYRWDEYDLWYKECLAAKLLFPNIDTYEVMPWPDRIFMPGYGTGGGTPGPARYRTILMSAITAMQDMPKVDLDQVKGGTQGLGLLVGDTAMWQANHHPCQDPFLGLLMPVLKSGIPISSVPAERLNDKEYMKIFNLLMLSYDAWKPAKKEYHDELVKWVKRGGVLILFDGKDAFDDIEMFWKAEGFSSPQAHLLNALGVKPGSDIEHKKIGRGHLIISKLTPEKMATDPAVRDAFLALLRETVKDYLGHQLNESKYIELKRGRYLISHTFDASRTLKGTFVDIYDENLPLVSNVELGPNCSAILLDVGKELRGATPRLLHSTFRLMGKKEGRSATTFFVQGPGGTEGKVRLFAAGKKIADVEAYAKDGSLREFSFTEEFDGTVLVEFPYDPNGIGFKVRWE